MLIDWLILGGPIPNCALPGLLLEEVSVVSEDSVVVELLLGTV